MYKAVLFDLDGTILNTLDDLFYSTNYALEQYNLKTRTYEEIRCFVGNGVRVLIEKAVGENNLQLTDLVIEKFKEHYQVHSKDHIKEYKGIKELLDNLKNIFRKDTLKLSSLYEDGIIDFYIKNNFKFEKFYLDDLIWFDKFEKQ